MVSWFSYTRQSAGLPANRPTLDIDVILEIASGKVTYGATRSVLEDLGYRLVEPSGRRAPVHRFERGHEIIDLMVEDHLSAKQQPTVLHRKVFQVPGGTSALRKVEAVDLDYGTRHKPVTVRVPDALGALVLKAEAFKSDPRDRDRHLDDAVILCCTIQDAYTDSKRMIGSDRGRMMSLTAKLVAEHPSWMLIADVERRRSGRRNLATLAQPPIQTPHRSLGR